MIHKERIKVLNKQPLASGDKVTYWMQASVRTEYNHALEYAIEQANRLDKPLFVYFGLINHYPEANQRHYQFLLEGLDEVRRSLQERNIQMIIKIQSPVEGALELGESSVLMVVDRGYLHLQRRWREEVAKEINCPLIQIESEVIVPVEMASPKEEYMAATLRRKLIPQLAHFLVPLESQKIRKSSTSSHNDSFNPKKLLKKLGVDRRVPLGKFKGGTNEAKKHLEDFLKNKLDHFPDLRNDPSRNFLSNMSPYLHFGQISPLYIALMVKKEKSPGEKSYLEELIVRRELSMNFVWYNDNYNQLTCLPEWAKKTLEDHADDPRDYEYSLKELEKADTHDPYWNAAQKEMVIKGKMHGYMRMYWGKKILEWTSSLQQAWEWSLYLNNKYELDGRDPNGYTGVAWCFGKHDRAWKERSIFGKVRYMNDKGLRRKFKIDKYVDSIDKMESYLT